jgi:hypothetical protein
MQNHLPGPGPALAGRDAPGTAGLGDAFSCTEVRDGGDEGLAPGSVRFASIDERDAAGLRLARQGMILIELEGIGPSMRGQIGRSVRESIERELGLRGAAGPVSESAGDVDADLRDQLYRARSVGASGIAIVLGPLRRAGGPLAALDPLDCHTLQRIARLAAEHPVVLLLDETDRETAGYGAPVALGSLLLETPDDRSAPGPSPEPARDVNRLIDARPSALDRHTVGASVVRREEPWRNWTLQLAAAKGPQPLAALERLFAESYMPLCNAIARGLDDPRARASQDEFRAAFAKSYSDTFPTLAVSTKRPRMVLDAHEVAARVARLHGARSTRLLLIDGMRWDLSRLIEQQVAGALGPRASITDELVLWSALPTTTTRQLETIARGLDALRAPTPLDEATDVDILRGRTSDYVRRLRVGPRELYKLDLVQARLEAAGSDVLLALPDIAEAAAQVVVKHAETLAPRTLLFVFGDHGFLVDRHGAATHGGASPEEVLCGAFGLLVGDVH